MQTDHGTNEQIVEFRAYWDSASVWHQMRG